MRLLFVIFTIVLSLYADKVDGRTPLHNAVCYRG